jgi:hypothetical protein
MTIIARRFASTPVRTGTETWERIVDLISKSGSASRAELQGVTGVAASLIADETPKEAPIVVAGNGPRLRVYCIYGEDAIVGDDCDESSLTWNPIDGDWRLFLPCPEEDLDWVRDCLRPLSKRIIAYDVSKEAPPEEESNAANTGKATFSVNVQEFMKK